MLLRGGIIVNSDRKYVADILIEKDVIKQIGVDLGVSPDIKIINVENMLIIPGGIDPSTNLSLHADHRDGLKAESSLALEGGTTTIINKLSSTDGSSLINALQTQSLQMKNQLYCNIGFFVNLDVTKDNCQKNMKEIVQNFGVNCFEINIGSSVDTNIISVMKESTELGCLLRIRAEDKIFRELLEKSLIDEGVTGPNGFIQSRVIEDEIDSIYHILKLNNLSQSAIFIPQIMNKEVAAIISDMKKNGRSIFCETITAALVIDGDKYFLNNWDDAASIVTEPPFRKGQTSELLRSLQNGDIDMLASQHTAITAGERAKGQKDFRQIPHGVTGVKERMSILWDRGVNNGLIDECQFVAVTSANAAKLFNMYPKRGYIGIGSIADIIVWNPQKNVSASINNHKSSDVNIFDGICYKGAPELVLLNGEIKFQNNTVIAQPTGDKIDLKNNSRIVLDKIKLYQQRQELAKVVVEHDYSNAVNIPDKEVSNKEVGEDKKDPKDGFIGKGQRPPTSSGNRNMQDSSFAFSGAQIDDDRPNRSSIRTNQPPGGKSSHIW